MKLTFLFFSLIISFQLCFAQMQSNKTNITNIQDNIKITEPDMVIIQGGTFSMGSNCNDSDELPIHNVTLYNFKMSAFEITFKQFQEFINETRYKTDAEKYGYSYIYSKVFEQKNGVTWKDDELGNLRGNTDESKPVIHVSWNDATAFCDWLSKRTGKKFRLPTEAEWEYAAGNGTKHTKYTWGENLPENDKIAGRPIKTEKKRKKAPIRSKFDLRLDQKFISDLVGSYSPNELGLYDMSGGVWEWCYDWYDINYYSKSPKINPLGPELGFNKVVRGANYIYDQKNCRVAYRSSANPTLTYYSLGFRVVCLP